MEVYLVRHTSVDAPGICYGQSEVPLAANYPVELADVRKLLPSNLGKAAWYSSPLTRCLQLAEDLASDAKVTTDKRLLELNFGDWELKTWEELDTPEFRHWSKAYIKTTCPSGEAFTDLYARTVDFWNELLKQDAKQTVIVTHAGVIRSIIAHTLHIPLRRVFQLDIDPGSLTKLNVDGQQVTVEYVNHHF